MPKRRILVCCVAIGSQFLLACAPTTKGYVGTELPSEQVALVRAISAENYFLRDVQVELMHPQTAEWVNGWPRWAQYPDKTGWFSVLPPSTCITVRALPLFCDMQGCQSWNMPWGQGELCFDVEAGSRYEIQVLSTDGLPCGAGVRLTGFRAVELESKETLDELSVAYNCPPPAE